MQTLQPNPYSPDQPVRDPDKFVGREDSLDWINQHLNHHALIVVHGPPRIGVSSLLHQVIHRLSGRFQTHLVQIEREPLGLALQRVARLISTGLGMPELDSPDSVLQALDLSLFDTSRPPVLIGLDGASALSRRLQSELLNTLATLASNNRSLRFVVAMSGLPDTEAQHDAPLRLDGLLSAISPIAQLQLGPLSRVQSELLFERTAQGLLRFDFNALESLWREANGRPHACQVLGYVLYERRVLMGRVGVRDVEQAVLDGVKRLSPWLAAEWRQYSRSEQLVVGAAASLRGEHGLITARALAQQLATYNVTLAPEQVQDALARLALLDVVEVAGFQAFRFSTGLIRDWAAQQARLGLLTGHPPPVVTGQELMAATRRRERSLRAAAWTTVAALIGFAILFPSFASRLGVAPSGTPAATATAVLRATPTVRLLGQPTAPRPEVVIAYMFRKNDKEKWHIYVAGQEGINPTPLTSGLSDDQWPSWSPDGSKIAFSSNRDGNWEIYVMNVDGSDQTRITSHPAHDWAPSWSPDGSQIVFSSYRDRNWEIYVINRDGTGAARLTHDGAEDWSPVWSFDGRVIAFASKRTGNHELYLMNPDGSSVTRLTETTATSFAPAWAPESRRIAFESFRDGNWEIYVMNGDGSGVTNLTRSPYADQSPSWSPDGRWIAYQSNAEGTTDIWVMRSDGSDAHNWTHGAGIAQSPAWRPLSVR